MLPKVLRILAALLAVRLALMAVVPVFEPSEARYAAISANMARTGDFVVPRFTHNCLYQSFDGKPPLVFQAGGLFCRLLGTESPVALQLGVRLFPLLSALLLLAILYGAVRSKSGSSEVAALAVAIAATSTAFLAAAGISMTDMSLTCCVAGALLLYDRFAAAEGGPESRRLALAAGVAALLGAGMIVKGPVALVEFGLPVLADAWLNRRWRAFLNWRWLAVSPVFLAVAAPWFVLVERVNPGAVKYFFYNENFLRFVSHDYGDRYGAGREAFRGVSLVWAFVATLPWALVPAWRALAKARREGARALLSSPALRSFEFVSVAAISLFWCLTSRVLLYYLFPVIPAFAAGLALYGDRRRLARLVLPAALLSGAVVTVALAAGSLASDRMRGPATEFSPLGNHYAHEFYHGTMRPEDLAAIRVKCAEVLKARGRRLPDGWEDESLTETPKR